MSEMNEGLFLGKDNPLEESVNSIRVEVRFKGHASHSASEVWTVEFEDADLEGPGWSRDWLVREVDRISWQGNERVPSELEFRQKLFTWGASGSSYSVILQVAEWVGAGIVGSTAFESFKNLVRLMRSRAEAAGLSQIDQPLSRDEAIFRAKWGLMKTYSIDEKDLRLMAEDHDIEKEIWVVTLMDDQKVEYQVTLGVVDGLPLTSRIVRRAHLLEGLADE